MEKNKELITAYIFWKKLCELQDILFDHYGEEFIDMHMDEMSEVQGMKDDDFHRPF